LEASETLIFTIDQETIEGVLDTEDVVVLDISFLDNTLEISFEEVIYSNYIKISKDEGNSARLGSDDGLYVPFPQLSSSQW